MNRTFPARLDAIAKNRAAVWIFSLSFFPLLNAILSYFARNRIPFFLDSIFTAVAAALFGVWPGIAVAILTNGLCEAFDGFKGLDLPFAACGVATALIVSAFVRFSDYRNPFNAVICVAAVAIANSLLGAIIAVYVFGGGTGVSVDTIVAGLNVVLGGLFQSAFLARIAVNTIDKAIAVIPALVLAALVDKDVDSEGNGILGPSGQST